MLITDESAFQGRVNVPISDPSQFSTPTVQRNLEIIRVLITYYMIVRVHFTDPKNFGGVPKDFTCFPYAFKAFSRKRLRNRVLAG